MRNVSFMFSFLLLVLINLTMGEEQRLKLSDSIECIVQAPAVVEEGQRYPVVFYLHGTGGQMTLLPLREFLSSRPVYLIGLTYAQQGQLLAREAEIQREVTRFVETRKKLSQLLPLDENQIYVSGFSKGGWVSAYLIERDPLIKGAMIMGAGALSGWPKITGGSLGGRSIYIGCGVEDKNHINSLRAEQRYRSSGARVTLDLWDRVGHLFPRGLNEDSGLQQWFDREFLVQEEFAKVAKEWSSRRLKEIRAFEPVNERCYQLVRFGEMPYLGFFGEKGQQIVRVEQSEQRKNEEFAKELQAYEKWSDLLGEELKSRKVSDLERYVRGYELIIADFPRSMTSTYAELEKQRIEEVLSYVGR